MHRTIAVAVAVVVAVAVALPAGGARAANPVRLTVGVPGELGSLDIRRGTSDVAREVWRLQYPTLTALDLDTLAPVPGVASGWTGTADRRTWTYTLRPDATWTDGTPVTAGDVVYSLEQARDGDWPYARGAFGELRAKAVDDHTVTVSTSGQPGALPSLLLHVVPRHVLEADADATLPAVGAGNWQVVDQTAGAVTLRVVERPGRPALDEIVFRAYGDTGALVDALTAGEVDVAARLPDDAYDDVHGIEGVQAIHANDGDQWVLRVAADETALRQALTRAFDRERLVARSAGGVGRVQAVPRVARGEQWWLDPDDETTLAGALGFDPGTAESLRRLDLATPLRVAADDDPESDAVRAFVEETLAASDVATVTVAAGEPADLHVVRRDPDDDPAAALAPYTCDGGLWCDASFDEQYRQLTESTDPTTQLESVQAMVSRLAESGVEIVLFAPDELQAFRTDDVVGLLRSPEEERLVVFWPSPIAYTQVVPTSTPGGETIPTATFVAIALATTALAVAAYVALLRRRDAHAPGVTTPAVSAGARPGAG